MRTPAKEFGRAGRETLAAGEDPIAGGNRDGWEYSTGRPAGSTIRALISRRLWVLSYRLEEARQRYANHGQELRQVAASFAQVLLRRLGMAS